MVLVVEVRKRRCATLLFAHLQHTHHTKTTVLRSAADCVGGGVIVMLCIGVSRTRICHIADPTITASDPKHCSQEALCS